MGGVRGELSGGADPGGVAVGGVEVAAGQRGQGRDVVGVGQDSADPAGRGPSRHGDPASH